jgi:hypothetical protein
MKYASHHARYDCLSVTPYFNILVPLKDLKMRQRPAWRELQRLLKIFQFHKDIKTARIFKGLCKHIHLKAVVCLT